MGLVLNAKLSLGTIVLSNYPLLCTLKLSIACQITTLWRKKGLFEGICEFVQQLPIKNGIFIERLATFRDGCILPTFISILGLSNGRSNEESISEVIDSFTRIDRSEFQKE